MTQQKHQPMEYDPTPVGPEERAASWVITRVGAWALSSRERAARALEEAIELAQAEGISEEQVRRQARHIYDRPPGLAHEEAGGMAVCLLAWCAANGFTLEQIYSLELQRIEGKPIEDIQRSLLRKKEASLVYVNGAAE